MEEQGFHTLLFPFFARFWRTGRPGLSQGQSSPESFERPSWRFRS
jgi:hypothetical protein